MALGLRYPPEYRDSSTSSTRASDRLEMILNVVRWPKKLITDRDWVDGATSGGSQPNMLLYNPCHM